MPFNFLPHGLSPARPLENHERTPLISQIRRNSATVSFADEQNNETITNSSSTTASSDNISKFSSFLASGIVLLGLFGSFLFASLFDDSFVSLANGVDFGQFRTPRDVIEFPRALFEKLRISEQGDIAIRNKLNTAQDILILRILIEVFTNIFTGFITYRYGHSCPIVFGCFSGLLATIGLVFSAEHRWLLIVTTLLHSASSGALVMAGLSLLVKFFEKSESRQRATTTLHMLSTVAYLLAPLSTVGMAFWGPWTVLIIIGCLLSTALLLFNLFFPIGHACVGGKMISLSKYCQRSMVNCQVLAALLCAFVISFASSILMSRSTVFLREIPDTEKTDDKVAVVVYGGFGVQLVCQLLCGIVFVKVVSKPGLTLVVGLFASGIIFMTYPKVLEENFWTIVMVQFIGRAFLGVSTIVIVPVLVKLVINEIRRRDGKIAVANNHGIIVGIYLAVYHLGFALGPICFFFLCRVRSITTAYTAIGVMLLLCSPFALGIVGRCLCTKSSVSKRRTFSFVTGTDNSPTISNPNSSGNDTLDASHDIEFRDDDDHDSISNELIR